MLTVLEFSVKTTYLQALIRHESQNSLYEEHTCDLNWNVEHMLRDKGNMRRGKFHGLSGGLFLRRPGGGGGEGLVDFRKNIYVYTVYPGSAHR